MLKEAIEALIKVGEQQCAAVGIRGERSNSYVVRKDLEWRSIPDPKPAKNFMVYDLGSLVDALQEFDAEEQATIWIGEDRVVALLDHDYLEDRVFLSMPITRVWATISEFPMRMTQVGLVRWLWNECDLSRDAVQLFRKIDIQRSSSGSRHVESHKETLGKAVEAKAQGTEQLPDTIRVPVRRWASVAIVADIEIKIELDFDSVGDEAFRLSVPEATLEDASSHCVQMLATQLVAMMGCRRVMCGYVSNPSD